MGQLSAAATSSRETPGNAGTPLGPCRIGSSYSGYWTYTLMAATSVLGSGSLPIISLQPGRAHGQHHGHHGGGGTTSGAPRVPSVRCATCSRELPLDQLSNHSCVPNTSPRSPPLDSSPSPPPSPAPALAPSRLASPSPSPSVMMTHPRTLVPGDPRPMMARSPSPLLPQHTQFIERNQRLPGRMIPQQHRPPQQPPWGPPMQHQQPMPQRQAPMPPSSPPRASPPRELDTKTGGEAGMAGVGRRGFAMFAAAAMFAASAAQVRNIPVPVDPGRRFNGPQHLDINSANSGDRGMLLPLTLPINLLR